MCIQFHFLGRESIVDFDTMCDMCKMYSNDMANGNNSMPLISMKCKNSFPSISDRFLFSVFIQIYNVEMKLREMSVQPKFPGLCIISVNVERTCILHPRALRFMLYANENSKISMKKGYSNSTSSMKIQISDRSNPEGEIIALG